MNFDAIVDKVISHGLSLGIFDRVNFHEPKNAPGNGLTMAAWIQQVSPAPGASGLGATTGLIILNVRLYSSMTQEPQDAIDPGLISAMDVLFTAYSGDFDLGGTVRNIDLLGQFGTPLSSQAGYLEVAGKMYRIMTIALPIVVNDLWAQVP
mgnify:FL=1